MVIQRPGTTLKHSEIINPQSSEAMLFAVLEMPSQEMNRGAPPLKLMGILFFFNHNQLVELSCMIPYVRELDCSACADHLRRMLLEMRRDYRNESNHCCEDRILNEVE